MAREIYPRFSPDGKWIAFSSNRYGNNDVFVISSAGGTPKRLTYHTGSDEVVGWTRDSQHVDLPRRRAATAPSPASRRCIRLRSPAARSSRCRSTGATRAAFRRTANRSCSTAIRPCGRASTIAAASRRTCGSRISATSRTRSCWPTSTTTATGRCGARTMRSTTSADPLPNDKDVKPGSADVRKSANNIYKIPVKGGQPVQVTKFTDGNLFWPSMSTDGKVDRLRRELRHLEAGRRIRQDERDQARHHDRREGQRSRDRDRHQRGRRLRHLAVWTARRRSRCAARS